MDNNQVNEKGGLSNEKAKKLFTMIAPSQTEANSKDDETTVDTSKS